MSHVYKIIGSTLLVLSLNNWNVCSSLFL